MPAHSKRGLWLHGEKIAALMSYNDQLDRPIPPSLLGLMGMLPERWEPGQQDRFLTAMERLVNFAVKEIEHSSPSETRP